MHTLKHRYFHAATNDGAPSGSPVPAPAPAPNASAPPAPTGDASALGKAPPASGVPESIAFVQEKYLVKNDKGDIDEVASIRKQAEAYGPLVKRMGSDELRPEKLDGYKLAAPEGMDKELFDSYVKDPDTQKFIEAAHAKGYTNGQLQFALEAAIQMVPDIELAQTQARDDATKAYVAEKMWKDEASQNKGFQTVLGAVDALASVSGISREAFTTPMTLPNGVVLPPAINDPRVLALLSAIAPELKTGRQPAGGTLPPSDLDSLVKSEAYMNPNHKDHLATKQKVDAHFASLPGGSEKPKGPVVIDTSKR